MIAQHAGREEIELYVLDVLDAAPRAELEAHVRGCRVCAAALAEEARLEETLRAALPLVRRPPARVVALPRRGAPASAPRRRAPALAFAAAAALVLSVGLRGRHSPPAGVEDFAGPAVCVGPAIGAPAASQACTFDASDLVCRRGGGGNAISPPLSDLVCRTSCAVR